MNKETQITFITYNFLPVTDDPDAVPVPVPVSCRKVKQN